MKTKRLFWAAVALMVAAAYGGRAYAATTHDHSGWTELSGEVGQASGGSVGEPRPINYCYSGNYVLTGDLHILNNDLLAFYEVPENHTVVICLNGHKIYGEAFRVAAGASLTICDCNASNPGTVSSRITFYAGGAHCNISDAIISGEVRVYSRSTCNITNCTFAGGRVYNEGTCTITDCTFTGYSGNYAAVDVSSGTCTITDCTYTGNTNGTSAVVVSGGTCNINGGTYTGNSAPNGSVVQVAGGECNISGGTYTGNSATGNGGVVQVAGGKCIISGGTYTDNSAAGDGGVVHVSSGTCDIYNKATLNDNSATNGGAVYMVPDVRVYIRDSEFTGNTASLDGGAVYIRAQEQKCNTAPSRKIPPAGMAEACIWRGKTPYHTTM